MGQSTAWKEWERVVAGKIRGERRGAYTGRGGQGRTDIIHDFIDAECKLLSQPQYRDLRNACRQAKENGDGGIPIAFVRKKGEEWRDALVVMEMGEFTKVVNRLEELCNEEDEDA